MKQPAEDASESKVIGAAPFLFFVTAHSRLTSSFHFPKIIWTRCTSFIAGATSFRAAIPTDLLQLSFPQEEEEVFIA
jgi:hypothetical protein